jgi:hypothetical protein
MKQVTVPYFRPELSVERRQHSEAARMPEHQERFRFPNSPSATTAGGMITMPHRKTPSRCSVERRNELVEANLGLVGLIVGRVLGHSHELNTTALTNDDALSRFGHRRPRRAGSHRG